MTYVPVGLSFFFSLMPLFSSTVKCSGEFRSFRFLFVLRLVRLLDDGQLGVGVRGGEADVRGVAGAVEHERPLFHEAVPRLLVHKLNLRAICEN